MRQNVELVACFILQGFIIRNGIGKLTEEEMDKAVDIALKFSGKLDKKISEFNEQDEYANRSMGKVRHHDQT